MTYKRLQTMYSGDDYYWGREPNDFARFVLTFAPQTGQALDLGAGEGRDSVLFAAHGLEVLAVDVSDNALAKASRLAAETGVALQTEQSDINTFSPWLDCDLIYSIGTVQYIALGNRRRQFDLLKRRTNPGGINAVFAFVNHPDVPLAPDFEEDEYPFSPGELRSYYMGWDVLYERSFVFDDESDGTSHKHAAEELIVRKPHK